RTPAGSEGLVADFGLALPGQIPVERDRWRYEVPIRQRHLTSRFTKGHTPRRRSQLRTRHDRDRSLRFRIRCAYQLVCERLRYERLKGSAVILDLRRSQV